MRIGLVVGEIDLILDLDVGKGERGNDQHFFDDDDDAWIFCTEKGNGEGKRGSLAVKPSQLG